MKIARVAVMMVAACGIAMVGCANQKTDGATASAKTVNAVCPVSGNPVGDSTVHVAYKGQEVGFCCANCSNKWNGMSDADKSAKLSAAMKAK